jgi:hypothetical protein
MEVSMTQREQVVLDEAPVLGPETADDAVVSLVDHPVPARGNPA